MKKKKPNMEEKKKRAKEEEKPESTKIVIKPPKPRRSRIVPTRADIILDSKKAAKFKSYTNLSLEMRAFLITYCIYANMTRACAKCGTPRSTINTWRKNDQEFAAAMAEAEEMVVDKLEEEAHRRAMRGSDALLIFLLKGKKPHVYKDNQRIEMSGNMGHDVNVTPQIPVPLEKLPLDLRKKIMLAMKKMEEGKEPEPLVLEHREEEQKKEDSQ